MAISFSRALELSGEDPKIRSVMLGNGFSIEASPVFHYQNLYDKSQLNSALKSMFEKFNTYDFEIIISELEHAKRVLEVYHPGAQDLISQIEIDVENLRLEFANAIIKDHARYQDVFAPGRGMKQRKRSSRKFLNNFSKIFTTNYDLVLYWQIMNECECSRRDHISPNFPVCDGFDRFDDDLIWQEPYRAKRKQNVFYLHGSLFLNKDESKLFKETKNSNSLLDSVRESILEHKKLPLIVLEGSHATKIEKIFNHPYLKDAYDKLGSLSGDLFIFGHSLKECDGHILDLIKNSNLKQIFISLYKEEDEGYEKRAAEIFKDEKHTDRSIYLFDSESAHVW